MTPIELSTRRRVTGLTSDEFARLFVSLQREVDGEAAQWSATDRILGAGWPAGDCRAASHRHVCRGQ